MTYRELKKLIDQMNDVELDSEVAYNSEEYCCMIRYWNEEGLNKIGKIKYNRILNKYCK